MKSTTFTHLLKVTLLSWFSMIGFDFFLHASILAPLYAKPSPFLLSPERAFALIPLGYLSFFVSAAMLVWLASRLKVETGREGFIFGLKLGAFVWGALTLSLLSITTADVILLVGWFVGQTLESAIAGLVIGASLGAEKLGRVFGRVLLFVIGSIVIGILLQNLLQFSS